MLSGAKVAKLAEGVARLFERVEALDRLMEAKFVTFRTLIDSNAEKVALALDASNQAIGKADAATQKAIDKTAQDVAQRFESVNEFRGQQRDIISGFMPRAEFEQFRVYYTEQHALLRDRYAVEISDLKGRLDRAEGRTGGMSNAWGIIVAAAGIVIAIVALVFRNM